MNTWTQQDEADVYDTYDKLLLRSASLRDCIQRYKEDRDRLHLQLCEALEVIEAFLKHWDQAQCRENARAFLEEVVVDRRRP